MRTRYILLISIVLTFFFTILGIFPKNIVSIFLGWLSLCFLIYSTPFYPNAIASRNWPTIDGVIVTSKIDIVVTLRAGKTSFPIIEYTYTVNGQEYKNDRIKIGVQSLSKTGPHAFEGLIKKYPVKKIVKVYHSARKPQNSVLEPGINIRVYGFTLGGVAFYLTALVVDLILQEIAKMPDIIEFITKVLF